LGQVARAEKALPYSQFLERRIATGVAQVAATGRAV
jgi:hypothetical protein